MFLSELKKVLLMMLFLAMHICKDKKLMLYRCVDYTKSVGSSEKIAMYRIENHIFHFMFMNFFLFRHQNAEPPHVFNPAVSILQWYGVINNSECKREPTFYWHFIV